jgi:hypothetical protein
MAAKAQAVGFGRGVAYDVCRRHFRRSGTLRAPTLYAKETHLGSVALHTFSLERQRLFEVPATAKCISGRLAAFAVGR